jgi:hypothetical protein
MPDSAPEPISPQMNADEICHQEAQEAQNLTGLLLHF